MIQATCQCQHIFCCWVEPSLLLSSCFCLSPFLPLQAQCQPLQHTASPSWTLSFTPLWAKKGAHISNKYMVKKFTDVLIILCHSVSLCDAYFRSAVIFPLPYLYRSQGCTCCTCLHTCVLAYYHEWEISETMISKIWKTCMKFQVLW